MTFAIYHRKAKSVFTGFLSRCNHFWLKNHWPRHLFKHRSWVNVDWQLKSTLPVLSSTALRLTIWSVMSKCYNHTLLSTISMHSNHILTFSQLVALFAHTQLSSLLWCFSCYKIFQDPPPLLMILLAHIWESLGMRLILQYVLWSCMYNYPTLWYVLVFPHSVPKWYVSIPTLGFEGVKLWPLGIMTMERMEAK